MTTALIKSLSILTKPIRGKKEYMTIVTKLCQSTIFCVVGCVLAKVSQSSLVETLTSLADAC